jgi:hypothetical protein
MCYLLLLSLLLLSYLVGSESLPSSAKSKTGKDFVKFLPYTCELPLPDTRPKGVAMADMTDIDSIGKTNKKGNIVRSARTVEKKWAEWLHHTNMQDARAECNKVCTCGSRVIMLQSKPRECWKPISLILMEQHMHSIRINEIGFQRI